MNECSSERQFIHQTAKKKRAITSHTQHNFIYFVLFLVILIPGRPLAPCVMVMLATQPKRRKWTERQKAYIIITIIVYGR